MKLGQHRQNMDAKLRELGIGFKGEMSHFQPSVGNVDQSLFPILSNVKLILLETSCFEVKSK
jgi:hypothetical protein